MFAGRVARARGGVNPGLPHKHAVDGKSKVDDSKNVPRTMYQHISNPHHQKHTMKASQTLGISRRWLGLAMSVLSAVAVQAQTQVTFQIDMSTETTTPTAVYISGSFNGWPYQDPATALINVGGTIWSNTFTINDPAGTVESCKFQDDVTGWEPLAANRQFLIPDSGPLDLPLTTWNNNSTWPSGPTNQVTFQVDMSAQVLLGNFTNGDPAGSITVAGDFEGWDNGLAMTNNPSLPGLASNIYSGVFDVVGFPPASINYKFRMNGGWESPASTGGNNRTASVTNNQVLPLVYYNDNSLYDLVQSPITVNFSVVVTNGTPDVSSPTYYFTKGTDKVYINGDFLNWWAWGINAGPAADEMIEVGTSDVYTNSFVIPKGNSIYLNYKYSFDGFDDENGFGTNHVREIRSYGPVYTFPQDQWSYIYAPGANTTTNIVEQDFGNLNIGAPSGGSLPITWLGRPGVLLQNSSSLPAGWSDNIGTDATQATNWPNAGDNQFFRLKKLK
jgi:hypothetical protein